MISSYPSRRDERLQGKNKNPMKAYALMTGVLSSLVGPILVGIFGGKWMDSYFGTLPLFLIIGLLLGMTAGVYAMTRLIQQFYAGDE
ncbi:AtpZ/AtpI family protein [Ectobacillus polymachus]|uniref:AtpZ/AtpI family protein n=1 Tax=Ectobacillus polymachus TaxID=1508806 RepID=UPI003A8C6929